MDDALAGQVTAVAALAEPTRRRLYDFVARSAEPVGRDDLVAELGIPRATVAFHIDKLVEEGLLDVAYERRSGRSGPGAGRPAKLYHRSQRHIAVSLPERHYDLAGRLLAAALEESDLTGEPAREALAGRAFDAGKEIGAAARSGEDSEPAVHEVLTALEEQGFEPRAQDDEVFLANCPFHRLAGEYPQLVCGMNLSLLEGFLAGIGHNGLCAHLDPASDRCCVRLAPASE